MAEMNKITKTQKNDIVNAVLIDSDDDDDIDFPQIITHQQNTNTNTSITQTQTPELEEPSDQQKPKLKKRIVKTLNTSFTTNQDIIEIGIDEVGRGPLFGRVYASAVILPKNNDFKHGDMKDSKKFTSKKKIQAISKYIKENSIAWSINYETENTIDQINILQATQNAMHNCISDIIHQLEMKNIEFNLNNILLLVDGNYFKPFIKFNRISNKFETILCHTIEQGDNKFTSIAAASILAKVERDNYIEELCEENPELKEKYKIDTNKGYGSKHHIEGIETHGITQWHRKTFGICKNY